ncbi:hypothetical protein D3C71_1590770 [compost metagenome]
MKVRGLQPLTGNCPHGLDHRRHLARVGVAGGVAQRDQVAARFDHLVSQRTEVGQRHLPLARAAEGDRHAGHDLHAVQAHLGPQLAHTPQLLDHFHGRAAYIGHAVRHADGDGGNDAMSTGLERVPGPTQVRRQCGDLQARVCEGVSHYLAGIGHLWQQARRHERSNFHVAHASGVGGIDPAALGGCRHDRLQALQTIAHADFVDCYCCHHGLSVSSVAPD